jgi:hypothetical protein
LFHNNSHTGILTQQNTVGDKGNIWGLREKKKKQKQAEELEM